MTQKNKKKTSKPNSPSTKKKRKKKSRIKTFLLSILVLFAVATVAILAFVYSSVREVPSFDSANILNELNLNSTIYDEDENVVERIHAEENRTIVSIDQIPKSLQDAFIAIEDERFYSHRGVDPRGIVAATFDNIRAGGVVRGASTITQQLAKNIYLTSEVKLDRKIKEAYIAIKLERELSKDQILEAYLNSIYLGQGAYGVSEAAEVYFSKSISDLTLAESALIAGVTKNPSQLQPYLVIQPNNLTEDHDVLGELEILEEPYFAVFNPESMVRQRTILAKMKELGFISESEYRLALDEDISQAIVPGRKETSEISSYFADYVKDQVLEDLVEKAGYHEEDAQRKLFTGGLKIYSTVDLEMQKGIEEIYDNFASYVSGGRLSSWRTDSYGNIISSPSSSDIVYYRKDNIVNGDGDLFLNSSEFTVEGDGDITISSDKISPIQSGLNLKDYFTTDSSGNLITHALGNLAIGEDYYTVENGVIRIKSDFLSKTNNFHSLIGDTLIISDSYFSHDSDGIMQPQSATVISDQSTGQLKAIVGGRNLNGKRIFNRANSPRQTGSSMKPLGAYLPALDNGFTAASAIDDVPNFNSSGQLWPRNYDHRFRGLISLRKSVELSINVSAVKALESVGIDTSMEYLRRMGIIKENAPDSFVSKSENPTHNDENPSSLALGGLSRGVSPIDMAGAYASIANGGKYIEPRSYTRVEDRNGNVILDNTPSQTHVVSPQVAYVMTDILRTTVSGGTGTRAAIRPGNSGIPVAGKTGTTDDSADVWFTGFSPYYTGAVWIGNDSLSVKLQGNSGMAAQVFSSAMKVAHRDLPDKNFVEPEGIVRRTVCTVSGKLASSECNGDPRGVVRSEIFVSGTEPTSYCDLHVSLAVSKSTGLLATDDCPPELVEYRTFLRRNPPYNPGRHGGIYPEDYQYAPPTEYSNCVDQVLDDEDSDEDGDDLEEDILDPDNENQDNIDNPNNSEDDPNPDDDNNDNSGPQNPPLLPPDIEEGTDEDTDDTDNGNGENGNDNSDGNDDGDQANNTGQNTGN